MATIPKGILAKENKKLLMENDLAERNKDLTNNNTRYLEQKSQFLYFNQKIKVFTWFKEMLKLLHSEIKSKRYDFSQIII